MSRFVRIKAVSWCALAAACALSYREGRAQGESVDTPVSAGAGDEQILVLRDGGVLAGRIVRDGERYVVTRSGSELRVAAPDVLVVCATLAEAYDYRRRQLRRPTAESHLSLAEWCLRYELVAAARSELDAARRLDGQSPRLAVLERRLAHASQAPHEARTSAGTEAVSAHPSIAEPAASANSDVPAAVVERFTRKVQPVLVNNCTASGCHRPGSAEAFQLDRALLHGLANRRSTMRNLSATLALVDRARPQLSPLLTVPRRAHGGVEGPIFGPRQEQAFAHLVEWVALVTRAESTEPPAAMSSEARAEEVEPASDALPAVEAAGSIAPAEFDDETAGTATATQPVQFGAQVRKWQPRDPFDPEIFNRRQRARRRPPDLAESGVEDSTRAVAAP
jgi:hypothetical protein